MKAAVWNREIVYTVTELCYNCQQWLVIVELMGHPVDVNVRSPSTAQPSPIGVAAEAVGVDVAPVDDLVLVLHCYIWILELCLGLL